MKRLSILLLAMVAASVQLCAENYPYRSDYLWQTVPNHANWIYKTGEKASIEVSLSRYGIPQDVEVSYEIAPDMMPATSKGKVRLKGGRAVIDIGTASQPGFIDLRLTAVIGDSPSKRGDAFSEGGKITCQHHVKVGFSPEKLKPYTANPADFDSFWSTAIDEARKAPLGVTCKKVDEYSTSDTDMYLVKMKYDKWHQIYAYLSMPKGALDGKSDKKYPVVLCPPGAGIKTIKEPMRSLYYARNGFIRMEMEIHGLNPEMTAEQFQEISAAFGNENGYLVNGLDHRDNYYMKHVYVACVRAMDYLTSLPIWDGRNLFVQGGSQGGALALITAGLDKRVTACVANHPALSDMAGYRANRAGGYPHLNRTPNMLTDEKVAVLQYFDVTNFARRITCPVYMTWGYNDDVCPPTTSYIVWNLIKSEKKSLVTPINEHWTTSETNYSQMLWLKERVATAYSD